MTERRIRILIAKVGLDGHDRGARVVARALRDGGMDVVYTGLHRTPEEVVAAAVQEDVDIVGISILSGAHMTLLPRVLELLRQAHAADIMVVTGGVIPDEDVPALRALGVADVVLPDTPPDALVRRLRELAAPRLSSPARDPARTSSRSPAAWVICLGDPRSTAPPRRAGARGIAADHGNARPLRRSRPGPILPREECHVRRRRHRPHPTGARGVGGR